MTSCFSPIHSNENDKILESIYLYWDAKIFIAYMLYWGSIYAV